jgi:hypothetical protein
MLFSLQAWVTPSSLVDPDGDTMYSTPLWNIKFFPSFTHFGGEATNTNFIVFGLTRSGLELTIYRTRGEHANHYATDAADMILV